MRKKWEILYDRTVTYSDGTKDESLCNLDTKINDFEIEELIENIYTNEKFLDCREDDVIDMSKFEIVVETNLFLENIYLWDADGDNTVKIAEYGDDEINEIYEELIKKGKV
jgi:hypothetical protein